MEFSFITLPVFLLLSSSSAQNEDSLIPDVEIDHMHIVSNITYRFATTEVNVKMRNQVEEAREAKFSVTLPESAFISNFAMNIDGDLYDGKVKPKRDAQREYTAAQERGESAAQITLESMESNVFTVIVNLATNGKVSFSLTYQELLQRRFYYYQHLINISPTQYVRDLWLDVYIRESYPITNVRAPSMRNVSNEFQIIPEDDNDRAIKYRKSQTEVYIGYTSCMQDQLDTHKDGQFIILYDVERDFDAGEVQTVDGYFVHFFAPPELNPFPKDITVILDVSSSMTGNKLEQAKDALQHMLSDLRQTDRFSIITFSSEVRVRQALVEATQDNVRRAERFVRDFDVGKGTNINEALVEGIEQMLGEYEEGTKRLTLIVLLTDGQPSRGVIDKRRIISNIEVANRGRLSLFSLGFGNDVEFNFLKKLSFRNKGFARKIYTGTAAAEQLKGFYDEISSPIMSDVKFSYLGESVEAGTLTETRFDALFNGNELIVAGKLRENVTSLQIGVSGQASSGIISLNKTIQISEAHRRSRVLNWIPFGVKLWAYCKIQELLDKIVATENQEEKNQIENEATEMSLTYNFVTPLTSMVVTTPYDPLENVARQAKQTAETGSLPLPRTSTQPTPGPENFANPPEPLVALDAESSQNPHRKPSEYHHVYGQAKQTAEPGSLHQPRHDHQPMPDAECSHIPHRNTSEYSHVFADNDLHFVIDIGERLCFDVEATRRSVLNIIHDSVTGIIVRAFVVGPPLQQQNARHDKTYLGVINLLFRSLRVYMTPSKILVNSRMYSWTDDFIINHSNVVFTLSNQNAVSVTFFRKVTFAILKHTIKPQSPSKVDYLGFYIREGQGLSPSTRGLIGQFLKKQATMVGSPRVNPTTGKKEATLRLRDGDRSVTARHSLRRNMDACITVPCWLVPNNGVDLLDD